MPQRSADVIRLQPNKRRGDMAYYLKRETNNEMRAPPSRKRWQVVDCEALVAHDFSGCGIAHRLFDSGLVWVMCWRLTSRIGTDIVEELRR